MFKKSDVDLVKKEIAYKGFYSLVVLTLKHKLFSRQGDPYLGDEYTAEISREVLNNQAAVGVILVDTELRRVALVEQFRVGPYVDGAENPWLLEMVAGHVEQGEQASDVARREALEEANCHITRLELINEYYSSPGGASQKFSLFSGYCDLSQAGGVYGLEEEDEDILVRVLSFDDFFQLLDTQALSNAHTIIAAQWLRLHHA